MKHLRSNKIGILCKILRFTCWEGQLTLAMHLSTPPLLPQIPLLQGLQGRGQQSRKGKSWYKQYWSPKTTYSVIQLFHDMHVQLLGCPHTPKHASVRGVCVCQLLSVVLISWLRQNFNFVSWLTSWLCQETFFTHISGLGGSVDVWLVCMLCLCGGGKKEQEGVVCACVSASVSCTEQLTLSEF